MKAKILIGLCFFAAYSFGQDDQASRIKKELVEWDAVRGEWLAESFQAMSQQQQIPNRTFPEDLTPAEMFSLVPQDRRDRIRTIANEPSSNPRENTRVPSGSESSNGQTRVPVGSGNPRVPSSNPRIPYGDIFANNGCNLTMGRSYGDPHIKTFDGKSFSFQTVGEYVLSASPDRRFEVQARQKPQTDKVSLNTATAMNVYGDRVGIYASDAPDRNSNTPLRVNGRTVYLSNETFFLPNGGTIQNMGNEYVVTWPTGEKVQAKISSSGSMRFLNISVYVYECRGNYFGIMGNANGNSFDDFTGGNSRNIASSTIFESFGNREFGRETSAMEREHLAFLARDFGNQFLVNDMTSLFDYPFGMSSWSFHDPSFPRNYITMGDINQADRDRARRECERQGIRGEDMNGCVMDMAHANVAPAPSPIRPDRTSGRTLETVTTRTPNINRPDIFDRTPAPSGTTRVPGGTAGNTDRDKTPTFGTDGSKATNNGRIESEQTTGRHPSIETGKSQGQVSIENEGPKKPTFNTGADRVRKPVEENNVIIRTPSSNPRPIKDVKVTSPSTTVKQPSNVSSPSTPTRPTVKPGGTFQKAPEPVRSNPTPSAPRNNAPTFGTTKEAPKTIDRGSSKPTGGKAQQSFGRP